VLGDIPSLREIWGPAALYVAPDDHQGLRNALLGLIENPEKRRVLGEAARSRALHATPERMGQAYLRA
jgi:glycogen synthase